MDLQPKIEELYARETKQAGEEYFLVFGEFKAALNEGAIRAAEPDESSPSGWRVNDWVKKGILLGFRIGRVVENPRNSLQFRDKHTYPLKQIPHDRNIRVVPGGSSLRDGC
jgi:2,3,4,5-tetrahydropyridine-2-carboxylate N-succinyltransferase